MAAVIVALALLGTATRAAGQREAVLHNFGVSSRDGAYPFGSLIFDSAGNLYGTTATGRGESEGGTVFELIPNGSGAWTEKILHTFSNKGTDGVGPYAGLTFDATGNLYGTTSEGGGPYNCGNETCGTVYELSPQSDGSWAEAVLHSFQPNGTDGYRPYCSLVLDAEGNLYGTTVQGGAYEGGTVFELKRTAGGGWTEEILHNFDNNGVDGWNPYFGGLTFDAGGDLYGTTAQGGLYGYGTVFEMKPKSGGSWTERVLYNFEEFGSVGSDPAGGLILDTSGNLYGTAAGGANEGGTVFELKSTAGGGWIGEALYSFTKNSAEGYGPGTGVIFDSTRNLYGTAASGGAYNSFVYGGGTVFELKATAGAGWMDETLHSFGSGVDGAYPQSGMIFDSSGQLYGMTQDGGPDGYGMVFEIRP
jgi:uncharacterized repeat protein (TIGR03803 family)